MGKGLLAQWRRGIVGRGLAAAALLAVPVGVAATIGFGTSLSGLSEGLGALASGPARDQAEPAAGDRDPLDSAIAAVATATTGAGDRAGAPAPPAPSGGGGDGGAPSEAAPDQQAPAPGADGDVAGADGAIGAVPPVEVPAPAPVADPVADLVDEIGNTVDVLIGGP